jgi:hypothetical protein
MRSHVLLAVQARLRYTGRLLTRVMGFFESRLGRNVHCLTPRNLEYTLIMVYVSTIQ